jgi:phosphatidylserine/phosphatidylglycerophosphate/cardiolipin synthase-like enzyme
MEWPAQGHVLEWFQTLKDSKDQTKSDDPNYWTSDPKTLYADSHIDSLDLGTGYTIYTNTILPAIAEAEKEVILVTCFWARSPTLDALNETLIALSDKVLRQGRKIRVRICLSSVSLWQKLFQTSSLNGRRYPPQQWRSMFGLPDPDKLRGLEMEVKSIFVLPFSVMHPKFVIIDRTKALLPSCNVSWENWFEGCAVLRGAESGTIVPQFVRFWLQFWARGEDLEKDANGEAFEAPEINPPTLQTAELYKSPGSFFWSINRLQQNVGWTFSLFLPSPHHRNPRFSFLPWKPCPSPSPTPLNTFLLSALRNAQRYIYIQTPNLTSPPVLSALLHALDWGVNITIVTSERLMILEQLVTAGTTTKRCLNKLIKQHKSLLQRQQRHASDWTGAEVFGVTRPGRLQVFFFQPQSPPMEGEDAKAIAEPTQSHLKLVNIDDEWTILGSGNMDRASWYTSQELGVAFWSNTDSDHTLTRVGMYVGAYLRRVMHTRKKCYYDGKMIDPQPQYNMRSNSFTGSIH